MWAHICGAIFLKQGGGIWLMRWATVTIMAIEDGPFPLAYITLSNIYNSANSSDQSEHLQSAKLHQFIF